MTRTTAAVALLAALGASPGTFLVQEPPAPPPVAPIPPSAPQPLAPEPPPHRPSPAAQRAPTPLYHDIVEEAARRYRVSARLIHAVIAIESAYRADAVSSKGAVGLMQLMPATAQQYGAVDLHDPVQNIHAGTRHLRELLEFFDHDVSLALAAYNAGAGAVKRYGGIPPYPETTRYVLKVLQRYKPQPRAQEPLAQAQ
jgi:soluble lytic murein transglycosylase-like protein